MIVRLDFGGEVPRSRVIRVDGERGEGVDLLAELGRHLPFREASVDEIFLDHAAAHADDFLAIMEECWRVAKPGTLVHARLPHASSSWAVSRDPKHGRHFTLETFNYFDPRFRDAACPSPAVFQVEHARLYLKGARRNQQFTGGALSRAVEGLANQNRGMQYRWERWFAPLVGGFEEFYVVLRAIKDAPYV